MNEALRKSEEFHIEQTMLDDKLNATDWEATNEEIMEIVARESYLQWLKDNEKRIIGQESSNNSLSLSQTPTNATCSAWDELCPSKQSPTSRHNNSNNNRSVSNPTRRSSAASTPPHSPSQSKQTTFKTSPKEKKLEPLLPKPNLLNSADDENFARFNNEITTKNTNLTPNNNNNNNKNMQFQYYDDNKSILNELPPDLFGLNGSDWIGLDESANGSDGDILARVLAASQQEYLENLKAKRHQQH